MPRSVQLANAAAIALGLLGLAGLIASAAAALAGGSASRALSPILAVALAFPIRARRREARVRELAFQFALLGAIVAGVLVIAILGVGAARGVLLADPPFVGLFALLVTFASALSRPSAKAWFDAGRPA